MEYLTASETLAKLKMGKVRNFTRQYFSQLVRDGYIPYHNLPGKKKKYYLYHDVKAALIAMRDPTRDAQREANARVRESNEKKRNKDEIIERKEANERYDSALELLDIVSDDIESKDDVQRYQIDNELNEFKSWNETLLDLIDSIDDALKKADRYDAVSRDIVAAEISKLLSTKDDLQEEIENIGGDIPADLKNLLNDANTPGQKVQITKDFWAGKINRQKYLEANRKLISVKDAYGVLDFFLIPFSNSLDTMHLDLKSRFPDVSMDAINWMQANINDFKSELQNIDFTKVEK